MSFGVGVADIIQALHFVKLTHDSWKDAPEKFRAIKQRLHALRGPLNRLAEQYADTDSHSHRRTTRSSSSSQRDLSTILLSIKNTLNHLDGLIAKRSDLNFWDRLRLNSHEVNDLSTALDRHVQDINFVCSSLGLENSRELRLGQEILRHGQRDLKEGQEELLRLVRKLLPCEGDVGTAKGVVESGASVGVASSLIVKDYGDGDDAVMWRDSHRRALTEGVTSRDPEMYQAPQHDALRSLGTRMHRDRRAVLQAPSVSIEEIAELTPSLLPRRSRRRGRHDEEDSTFTSSFPSLDVLPSQLRDRSPSRSIVSREPTRPFLLSAVGDARSPRLEVGEEEESCIIHLLRERSRHRHRRRGHSLSVECELSSEVILVVRERSVERRR